MCPDFGPGHRGCLRRTACAGLAAIGFNMSVPLDFAAAAASSTPGPRRSAAGAFAIFVANGIAIGVWGAALPGLRDRVGTDAHGLAILLVVTGICAVASMQFGGRIADRRGAKTPTYAAAVVLISGLLLLSWAPTYPILLVGGAILGLGNGTMDVTMNSLAVDAEKELNRSVMSRMHAGFSIGGLIGSGLVLLLAGQLGLSGSVPIIVAAAGCGLVLAGAYRHTAQGSIAEHHVANGPDRAPGRPPALPPVAWLLGAMAMGFGITEGTGLDWAATHVTDVARVDPGTGALGLVAVSATMVLIRLVGDHAVDRFGRSGVVRFGSVIASGGYLVVAFVSSLPGIVVGWLLVGLGVGLIAPQIYGLAGYIGGGRVLAVVTGFGYTAFLCGPAVIGFVAGLVGLQRAMLVPLVSACVLVVLSLWMPQAPGDEKR